MARANAKLKVVANESSNDAVLIEQANIVSNLDEVKIPLSDLYLSELNVRRTPRTQEGIEQMAASIQENEILNALFVVKNQEGRFGVVAGGYRYLGSMLLADKLGKRYEDVSVRCKVISESIAVNISLIENTIRQDMHASDKYMAFKKMSEEGKSITSIALSFNMTESAVNQFMRLGNASPLIMEKFIAGELKEDQMKAFCIKDDHALQEQVFHSLKNQSYYLNVHEIKNYMMDKNIMANDSRVSFITLEAYLAAGGETEQDLFAEKEGNGIYIKNEALLDDLVMQKLNQAADEIKLDGWKWVEVLPQMDWDYIRDFERCSKTELEPNSEQEARIDELEVEIETTENALQLLSPTDHMGGYDDEDDEDYDEENEDYDDSESTELSEDDKAKIAELQGKLSGLKTELNTIKNSLVVWSDETREKSGVVVSRQHSNLHITYGLMKPEETQALNADGSIADGQGKAEDSKSGLSQKLKEELGVKRTRVLQVLVSNNRKLGLVSAVYNLASRVFYTSHWSDGTPTLGSSVSLDDQARELNGKDSAYENDRAYCELGFELNAWEQLLPVKRADLFNVLLNDFSEDTLLDLLAFCTARGMNCVNEDFGLMQHLGVNMAEWWTPTAGNYLSRVSRDMIIEALKESGVKCDLASLMKLKKGDMAKEAEKLLAGSGWIPKMFKVE